MGWELPVSACSGIVGSKQRRHQHSNSVMFGPWASQIQVLLLILLYQPFHFLLDRHIYIYGLLIREIKICLIE